jgi:hypothetical protein
VRTVKLGAGGERGLSDESPVRGVMSEAEILREDVHCAIRRVSAEDEVRLVDLQRGVR